jgi:uncharacterized Zn finger protein
MAIPGETGHIDGECMDCGTELPAKVLKSGAGYYIGTFCPNCGPYSRESGYYPNLVAAQEALRNDTFFRM